MRRERLLPALFWGAASCIVPVAILHFVGRHEVHLPGTVHFGAVAAAAVAAVGCSLALTISGARRHDGRVVAIAGAFSVMAALLLMHGLATPGLIVGDNGLVALTGALTLPIGGALLAFSATRPFRRADRIKHLIVLQAVAFAAIAILSTIGMLAPSLVPGVPGTSSTAAHVLLGVGLLFYAGLARRAFRTFLLTRRTSDLVVVVGIVWLAAALLAALTLGYWDAGWWIGHLLEILGIGLVGGVVAADLHRAAWSRPLFGDLRATDLVAEEEAFLGSQVRALLVSLAAKDRYTEGHTRRVATLAVAVGEELGLSPSRLRSLAAAGLLHDIGKLSLPIEVLNKPGALDAEEYAMILSHPERGAMLLNELGDFPDDVVRLVFGHHERLDGGGYPLGRAGDELDLETRIIGTCDVYDALVSDRVYREAWTRERAVSLLRDGAGIEFDGACVDALERVLEHAAVPHVPAAPAPSPAPAREPVMEPLLPSIPTVFASSPARIIRKP